MDAVRAVFEKDGHSLTVSEVYAATRAYPAFSGFRKEQITQACIQLSKTGWLRKIGRALFERTKHAETQAPVDIQGIDPDKPETSAAKTEKVLGAGVDATSALAVSLECDLEAFLRRHLSQLEPDLKLWEGAGQTGQQLPVGDAGRLDLLAVDSQNSLVVIELKAGRADACVLGQVLGYMGWLRQNLSPNSVRGIVVAHDFTERLRLAAQETPSVRLLRYDVKFEFTAA